jgi:hypothetical protein
MYNTLDTLYILFEPFFVYVKMSDLRSQNLVGHPLHTKWNTFHFMMISDCNIDLYKITYIRENRLFFRQYLDLCLFDYLFVKLQ